MTLSGQNRLLLVCYEYMNYANRIICNPSVLGGKPAIKDTRIPVQLILELLAQGTHYEEVLEDYPDLELADILAAIAYARDAVAVEEVSHLHAAQV